MAWTAPVAAMTATLAKAMGEKRMSVAREEAGALGRLEPPGRAADAERERGDAADPDRHGGDVDDVCRHQKPFRAEGGCVAREAGCDDQEGERQGERERPPAR